jgi:hypothetical protein
VAHTWKEGIRTACFSANLNGRVHLEDKGVDGKLLLRVIINSVKDVDQLNIAQVVVQWRCIASTEINCRVSYESKNFFTSLTTVSFSFVSHKGVILLYLCSVHVSLGHRSSSFMKFNVMLVDELYALSQQKRALKSDPVSV